MDRKTIKGIDQWNANPDSLPDSLRVLVGVSLKRPDLQEVIRFPKLKDRVKFSRKFYKQELESLTQKLNVKSYELVGTAAEYRGFSFKTTLGELCARLDESIQDQVWIQEMEGHTRKEPPAEPSYYCLKVLFKIQYEGIRSRLQQYDEQLVVIRAESAEQAEAKLWDHYIPAYETPYLNSDLRLVRWKFQEVLDHNRVELSTVWETDLQQGLEIFSEFRDKRLKKADYWNGSVDSRP